MPDSFIRKIDDLGRVVLPVAFRRALGIGVHDTLELTLTDGAIVLRRREPRCVFCNSKKQTTEFRGQWVCGACRGELGDT